TFQHNGVHLVTTNRIRWDQRADQAPLVSWARHIAKSNAVLVYAPIKLIGNLVDRDAPLREDGFAGISKKQLGPVGSTTPASVVPFRPVVIEVHHSPLVHRQTIGPLDEYGAVIRHIDLAHVNAVWQPFNTLSECRVTRIHFATNFYVGLCCELHD